MKPRSILAALSLFVVMPALLFAAQTSPPKVLIDKDICPGEGCSKEGNARATKSTKVYAEPNENSSAIWEFTPGVVVTSSGSEVHTAGGRFVVKRAYENYQPGDVLWVYTYIGEGVFKVWHEGKMYEEKLDFSPWGGSAGKRCEKDDGSCWGELEKELEMTWWLKAKSIDGQEGWIRVDGNLEWEHR